jgi:glycosyltransferase involved in cell wall biosynthesis
MTKVILVHQAEIQHYRVPIYSYLSSYLRAKGFEITVVSQGIEQKNPHMVEFDYRKETLTLFRLSKLFVREKPVVVIFWINPNYYIFPLILFAKYLGIKVIHWGQHRDLQDPHNPIKNIIYFITQWLDDAIILYSQKLKETIVRYFHAKTFVANNTLNVLSYAMASASPSETKRRYGISAKKNIIYLGRMQKRKRIGDLVKAFRMISSDDLGLILAGPDNEGILNNVSGERIYKIGPVYGRDSISLLNAADVYCMPGAIGLGIVDALYCGLPVVTENVRHGPEIMYLKNGVNGFMVEADDINDLAKKLELLIKDNELRARFSKAAREEISINGHIDRLCEGFYQALQYINNK